MSYFRNIESRPNLIWSPTNAYIQEQLISGEKLRMIMAPFIRKNALSSLIEKCEIPNDLSIITRWTRQDIVTGISDLEIYPFLKDRGIALYLNQTIHLKMLVFASNWAFVTSSNITGKGLGLTDSYNLEVGCRITLGREDWQAIYQLLGTSFRVDNDIYQKAVNYRDVNYTPPGTFPDLNLSPDQDMQFSILSLPSTDSPSEFYALYNSNEPLPLDNVNTFMHDIALYNVRPGMKEHTFYSYLRDKFRSQPFTQTIVDQIKRAKSARFGLVNKWLQTHCSDKPTPYRWELKPATRCLYSWLDHFYEEISWDRPHYSMVIRWKEVNPGNPNYT